MPLFAPMTMIVVAVLAACLIAGLIIVLKAARSGGPRLSEGHCPRCGTPNEATAKFCGHCGTKLHA